MSRSDESKGSFPFIKAAHDLDDFEKEEEKQRMAAVIATMACDLPRHAMKEGARLAAIALKPRVITKYEYNQNRVRDFRVCKEGEGAVAIGDVPDDEIKPSSFDPYPPAFTREYCRAAFEGGAKLLHEQLWSFSCVRLIDMSELLIGDEGFARLCDGLERCPVHTLILTNNRISDEGLLRFAEVWRSMAQLSTLKLANNKFTDKGVEQMFHPTRYSPSVRALDLSKNRIGVRTAFYLGLMFAQERVAQLEDLNIGVRVGSLSHGDNFVKVLVALLTAPRARPIRRLDLSDTGLSDVGVAAVASLVVCSDGLKELRVSRNYMSAPMRSVLFRALVANKSITVFHYFYCGFNSFEEDRIKRLGYPNVEGAESGVANVMPSGAGSARHRAADALALKYQKKLAAAAPAVKRPVLSWEECVDLCGVVTRVLYAATAQMRKVLEGVSHNDIPPPLPANKMFASEARGKLTVLQQISMFGRRSLKATPLRDELDALKYVTIRPVPVTFKKAMYLLSEIKKMTTAAAAGAVVEGEDDSTLGGSVAMSVEAGPQLYIKLIYGNIIHMEKWMVYLQTLHLSRGIAFTSTELVSTTQDGGSGDTDTGHTLPGDATEGQLWRRYNRACEVAEERLEALRVHAAENASSEAVVDILMEQASAQQQQVLPPTLSEDPSQREAEAEPEAEDDFSVDSRGVSSLGDLSAAASARASLAPLPPRPPRSVAGSAVSPARSLATGQSRSVRTGKATGAAVEKEPMRVLSGYAFLWAHLEEIFPPQAKEEEEECDAEQEWEDAICRLETTAMAMEDYASALSEKKDACERVIACNMKDSLSASLPDTDLRNALRLPFVNNIGLPSFFVHKCMVELLHKDKNPDSNDVYSQADSTQASTCLDIQIKRKKKQTRKQRKIVGRRFGVYSNSQKARRNQLLEQEEEEGGYIDGESLTVDSLGASDSVESNYHIDGASLGEDSNSMSQISK